MMKKTEVIRVLVADDHAIVRQGVVALINRRRGMKVVAEAGNGRAAVKEFNRHHPDICLIDLRMP
jgi:DNA-binding NarL/FixJ family response regulator